MSDPLEALASSLDLNASRVINSPALIFLCGGPIPTKAGDDPSLRSLFYQHIKQDHPNLFKQVHLAETANEWAKTAGHYQNVLDLENDLAYLSAVILLFVESAGSIAELGAFCQLPGLRDKLVAILEYSHQTDNSFIQVGPISLLRQQNTETGNDSVLFYRWLRRANKHGRRGLLKSGARETVDRLLKWLSQRMAGLTKEKKFRADDTGHRLLLVADSIDLGTIVLKKEITSFLKGLGISFRTKDVDKYLFLLQKLRLIDTTEYGHNTYYVAGSASAEYVHHAYKGKGKTWDREQVKSDLSQTLLQLDPDRKTAWKLYQERAVSNG